MSDWKFSVQCDPFGPLVKCDLCEWAWVGPPDGTGVPLARMIQKTQKHYRKAHRGREEDV